MNRRISSSSASAAIIEQVCGEIATRLYVSIAGKLKVAYAKVTVGIVKTSLIPLSPATLIGSLRITLAESSVVSINNDFIVQALVAVVMLVLTVQWLPLDVNL